MPYQRPCWEGALKEGAASQAGVLLAGGGFLEGALLEVVRVQMCWTLLACLNHMQAPLTHTI